jgi:hypothetical protein
LGRMGNGYGSEYHLLRILGRHRDYFNQRLLHLIAAKEVEWLDFPFDSKSPTKDREWKGLDFVEDQRASTISEWEKWWPLGRGIHNWDAVGRINLGTAWEWLLVEAKANIEENSFKL